LAVLLGSQGNDMFFGGWQPIKSLSGTRVAYLSLKNT